MKRGQKQKTKNLVMITATLSMFATGIMPSLEVFAEEQAQHKKVSTTLQNENSVNVENRVFAVAGKGDVSQLQNVERRERNFSAYEPTGLYAKQNEQITIHVQGNQSIQAYIGTFSFDASWREDSKIKSFTLNPGTNTIQSPNGGMIYFYNKQQG
ncbi:M60 family peptidase N-terminal accessory domain-containing protein, partial [Bacillus mycoides]